MFLILTGEQAAGKRTLVNSLQELNRFKPVDVFWTYTGDDDSKIDKEVNKEIGYRYIKPGAFYKLKYNNRFDFKWSFGNGYYQYAILKNSIDSSSNQVLILEPEEVEMIKLSLPELNPIVVYLKTDWFTRLTRLYPADQRDILDKIFDDKDNFVNVASTFFVEGGRYKDMVRIADIVLLNDDGADPSELCRRLQDAINEYRVAGRKINLRYLA